MIYRGLSDITLMGLYVDIHAEKCDYGQNNCDDVNKVTIGPYTPYWYT